MNPIQIKQNLSNFTGTTIYHRHESVGSLFIQLTDGCNYLREECKAYWLFDLILSYQPELMKQSFQVWRLKRVEKKIFIINCEDGNDNEILKQEIPYSDFPLDEIVIWLCQGVALLPSEY